MKQRLKDVEDRFRSIIIYLLGFFEGETRDCGWSDGGGWEQKKRIKDTVKERWEFLV